MLLLEEAVFFIGKVKGIAQSTQPARNDRDFGNTRSSLGEFRYEGMAAFMIRDDFLFKLIDFPVLFFQTDKGSLYGFHQI